MLLKCWNIAINGALAYNIIVVYMISQGHFIDMNINNKMRGGKRVGVNW